MSEETRHRLLAVARRVRADGPLRPLVVIEGADETLFFDAAPFWGEHGRRKRVMRSLGGTLGYGVDAQRIYVVVEMWIAEESLIGATEAEVQDLIDRTRRGDVVAPSDRPDRQSAIQVIETSPTETPAGSILQKFKRRKGKLRWDTPREWRTGEYVEDFTFGEFWVGLGMTEAVRAAGLDAIAREIGMDDDQTDASVRRAARRAALANFGTAVFEEHEIGRVMRRWRQR